jgi:hypothetical protein
LLTYFTIFTSTPKETYAAPTFQMPFPCNQTWYGETRKNHNPKLSIDFTRKNGNGDPIVASASGKVKKIGDLGNKSFGKFVYIDHGNGWETRHAHLSKITVKKGQSIKLGQQIGNVGNSGNSTAPHLHYEQKHKGKVKPVSFGSSKVYYYGKKKYKSKNKCTKEQPTGTVKTKKSKKLAVHQNPTNSSKVVKELANNSKVTIYCQIKGSLVKGPYGTSTLWDKIGKDQYVPDSYIYTGSDGQIAPTCK